MKKFALLAAVAIGLLTGNANAQIAVYDGVSDLASFTTTTSTPHTYTGQAFSVSNAGGATPQITGGQLGLFVLGAQTIPFARLNIQFWGTFDPLAAGTSTVFSNPVGSPIVFNLAPITTTGNAVLLYTLNFASAVTFPQLSNLGIGINWQTSADGVTYVDNTNLVTAMRPVASGTIPVGLNITTAGGTFFRNASNRTDFNFQADDSRGFTGGSQATGGLAMRWNVAVPEPTSMTLAGVGLVGFAWRRWRKAK